MKAVRVEAVWVGGMWEVTHGERWWSVARAPDGAWVICNEKLAAVEPTGRLGKRLIACVERAEVGEQR